MSSYVSYTGYSGTLYDQSVLWHYKTDMNRNILNRWYANIFSQGVLNYTPSGTGGTDITIAKGTSLIINDKNCASNDLKIAKLDMYLDYVISVSALSDAAYYLYAVFENTADEYVGVDFYLATVLPSLPPAVGGYWYVVLGQVTVLAGVAVGNTTFGQTICSIGSGIIGYSGYSGITATSGYSGKSGISGYGFSGYTGASGQPSLASSGYTGWSGVSGYSGANPGLSGWTGYTGYSGKSGTSGYSGSGGTGYSGVSGKSGWTGYSGYAGNECIIIAASDELSPLTTGTRATFRMPYGFLLSKVKGSLTTGGTSLTSIDVRQAGSSILNTKINFNGALDKSNSVTGAGILTSILLDDYEITVYFITVGSGATGVKVYLIGTKI